jgi:hypothetical protein
MRSVFYKIQGDPDTSMNTPEYKKLGFSSYMLFDTVQVLSETFFSNLKNMGDISGGKSHYPTLDDDDNTKPVN